MAGPACDQCNRPAPAGARFCPRCGAALQSDSSTGGFVPPIELPGPHARTPFPAPAPGRCCRGGANVLLLLAGLGMIVIGLRVLSSSRTCGWTSLRHLVPSCGAPCGGGANVQSDDDPGLWTEPEDDEVADRSGRSHRIHSEPDEDRPVRRPRGVRIPSH